MGRESEAMKAYTYAGLRNSKVGYESLVQAATDASRKFSLNQQRELVLQALDTAIPRLILDLASSLSLFVYVLLVAAIVLNFVFMHISVDKCLEC